MGRILWNQRPEYDRPSGGGDIDEVVLHDVTLVHIEQMDDRCWWIPLNQCGYTLPADLARWLAR